MSTEDKLREHLKLTIEKARKTREKLHEVEARLSEPIAIVGMGCRYPGGVSSPDQLWRLVSEQIDAVAGLPEDRGWPRDLFDSDPDAVGKSYARAGGFLYNAGDFDAGFFGIAPREALAMDPQQRLLLETAWETIEHAGIDPTSLRGTQTGVYVGAISQEYGPRVGRGHPEVEGLSLTGTTLSVASGRVSYVLGLLGPAVTVDTACSSSLVALHQAVSALRAGECSMALAGGVTVISGPGMFVEFSRQRVMSADARCKSFAAAADGAGWSEGVGLLLLERLSDARRLGHEVLAVVRGSAVNQDGASNGLTAPNGPSQQRVIRAALANAGLPASAVDVVEAHGTGTRLGDPIEAEALLATYGQDRGADRPLWLGSVKSNIGHSQAAAGVAGVIKMVMAMREQRLPATLHVDAPSPHVDWSSGAVQLLTSAREWDAVADAPRRAAVSSFGISGTNAHVILEESAADKAAPEDSEALTRFGATKAADLPSAWVVSAKSAAALRDQAASLLSHVRDRHTLEPVQVGRALRETRTLFDHRAVIVGGDRQALLTGLAEVAAGQPAGVLRAETSGFGVAVGAGAGVGSGVGVVFSGQGSQRVGMGLGLTVFPAFAAGLDRVCSILDPLVGTSIREVIASGAGLDDTGLAQPALFALEVALYELLSSWGVKPTVLVGHSVGEIAAAHVAGVLDLNDACLLVAARARLMQQLPVGGAMASVSATEAEVTAILDEVLARSGVAPVIAAVNGPAAVVVSGAAGAVAQVVSVLEQRGRRVRLLRVSHAFHSPLMEPMTGEFAHALSGLTFRPAHLPIVSTSTGTLLDSQAWTDPRYWVDQILRPVRFADAITVAAGHGVAGFLELGPDPSLTSAVAGTLADSHPELLVTAALRRDRSEPMHLLTSLAELFTAGQPVDWRIATGDHTGSRPVERRIELPTYAFQHQRYWLTGEYDAAGSADAEPAGAALQGYSGNSRASEWHERFRNDEPGARREMLRLVTSTVLRVLGLPAEHRVDVDTPFLELGMTSILAVDLRNALKTSVGCELPATVAFDHPSIRGTAEHLCERFLSTRPGETTTAVLAAVDEPIAIVGMGCRFPGGVSSPELLWRLVSDGVDAISGLPEDRGWPADLFDPDPDAAGKSYAREGGFLYDAADFDAAFFGISPREAVAMDPQQRLLLETVWETIEHAGIDPISLRDSATGVFVGGNGQEYATMMSRVPEGVAGYLMTGTAASVLSGRVSYALGLVGPAVSVDTACSSSLVALHQAVSALRAGECSMALAGGVTVMSTPGAFLEFSRQRGLAPDGRCKSFSAAADGVAWSEGVGMLLLERLSDARQRGHEVLAVVRGSAVNQDGASNGLTAPNGPSQQRVMRSALANAGLSPTAVDVVEAHGTGTRLGDPIEAGALLATYGRDRPADRPLWLGSVKSNIGHSQAAAGVAGVIKMVMAMRHRWLPATLHVDAPSPQVDWSSGAVELLTAARAWEAEGDVPRRAAVSSFGASGTNAHVILEEAPGVTTAEDHDPDALAATADQFAMWVVSAKSTVALRDQANRLLTHVQTRPELNPAEVARALQESRALFDHRAVIVGRDREAMLAGLAQVAAGQPVDAVPREDTAGFAVAVGADTGAGPGVGVVFSGQGSQRAGMGLGLCVYPAFASALDRICAVLDPLAGVSVREVIASGAGLDETGVAQPALFALEVALYELLRVWGVEPRVLVGHSVGEIAAAHVAGVLSLNDACVLVTARARLMQQLPAGGAMAAITATEAEVRELLGEMPTGAAPVIAAVNGPAAVVVSGAAEAVADLVQVFTERGRRTRSLRVSHAFHSPLMASMTEEFAAVLADLTFQAARVPIISTATGTLLDAQAWTDPHYWVNQILLPVRFADAIAVAAEQGIGGFVELGPDPSLTGAVSDTLVQSHPELTVTAALRRDHLEPQYLLTSLAELLAIGAIGAGTRVGADSAVAAPRRVELPTYAFQRKRFWLEARAGAGDADALGVAAAGHPLLGVVVELPAGGLVVTAKLSLRSHTWLADHQVAGAALLPGTGFVELLLAAGDRVGCTVLEELTVLTPLLLSDAVQVRVTVGEPDSGGRREASVHSRPDSDVPGAEEWILHAGAVLANDTETAGVSAGLGHWPPTGATELDLTGAYERVTDHGYGYGPAFQGLRRVWRRDEEIFAEIGLPAESGPEAGAFLMHPALLDSALHAMSPGIDEQAEQAALPFAWRGVRIYATGAERARVRIAPVAEGGVSVWLVDDRDAPILTADALSVRPIPDSLLRGTTVTAIDSLYELEWIAQALPEAAAPGASEWVFLGGNDIGAVADVGAGRWLPDLSALTAELDSGGTVPPIVLVPIDAAQAGEPMVEGVYRRVAATLALLQAWLAEPRVADSRLVVLTRYAVGIGGHETGSAAVGLATGSVWGLVRSAQTENPDRFTLIDTDGLPESRRVLAAALGSGESQLVLRNGQLTVPRLARVRARAGDLADEVSPVWDPEGTVLITGGSGALGSMLARHLVTTHGVRHVLLVSRRGEAAEDYAGLRADLLAAGAVSVRAAACDVADRAQLAAVLAGVDPEFPVRAVVHTAGVLEDGVITSLTEGQVRRVLSPKVDAAWNLHELTRDLDLRAFVLYSSSAATFGAPGQGNYAAGNAFLEGLARYRHGLGLPATALAWGLWEQDSGMTGHLQASDVQRIARQGMALMRGRNGLEMLDETLAQRRITVLPMQLDLSVLRTFEAADIPPILRSLMPASRRSVMRTAGAPAWLDQLGAAEQSQRKALLDELVLAEISTLLGHSDPASVTMSASFAELGFDSLSAVDLRNRLKARTGINLSTTLVFDYPSPLELSDYLSALILDSGSPLEEAELTAIEELIGTLEKSISSTRGKEYAQGKLKQILAQWSDSALEFDVTQVADMIQQSTADELFSFVDQQLGLQQGSGIGINMIGDHDVE
ncbi:type I polyketide synthase [Nocardia lijiangensis]|uniref:type I polyketide synthase n=1 Tax=Nocardia lijiangensis TaxID=299618 RepID=UPI0008343193|nr:type I polyketide synthase [Nocardia lijiangensis]